MDWKLELVVVPVADQDRAKAFYVDAMGFDLIVDHRAGEHFRVIQASPPGSACTAPGRSCGGSWNPRKRIPFPSSSPARSS